jgi:UPF0755 protein
MTRHRLATAVLWLGSPLVLLVVVALAARHDLEAPYADFPAAGLTLEIPSGSGAGEIASLLKRAGVIPSSLLFRAQVRLKGLSTKLQAGEYRFDRASSPVEVAEKLVRGEVFLHGLTVPEGLTLEEIARIMSTSRHWEEVEIQEALTRPELLHDLDPQASTLEGYLFPDTYRFPRGFPADDLVLRMLERFRETFGPDARARADELGLSVREVVTLASLVEEEARLPHERPLVASVIRNRLARGMKLEIDPTVIYALQRAGRPVGALRRSDLSLEDPYNTYLHPGLPPGPICSPGLASLEAALHPAESDYLYFVVDPSRRGAHHFSSSYREHMRAVRRYRAQDQYR